MSPIAQRYFLTAFTLFALFSGARAQVLPPDFLCLKGDTLIWNTPVNNCGPFNAYEIFFSDTPDGPFSLLATITDPTQTNYVHNNPGSQVWYYYLQSDYDCPGQIALPSDTLDNLIPEDPVLQSVSVVGNTVEITWTPSPSPEVTAYIIYRLIGGNVNIIDTAFSNTYTDTTANPLGQSELYYILALDECGNTSIFLNPHSTIFLDYAIEPCSREVQMSWNLYENWSQGIGRQEVWVQQGGGAFTLYETLGPSDMEFAFPIDVDNENFCFYLKAVEANTGVEALSNTFCVTPDIVQGVNNFALVNATYTDADEVEITWVWDTDAELDEVRILRKSRVSNGPIEISAFPPPDPLPSTNQFLDTDPPTGEGPLHYLIRAVDQCGFTAPSNQASTIFLQGAPQPDQVNALTWTDPGLEGASVTAFDLFRLKNGIPVLLAANLPPSQTTFFHPVDPTEKGSSTICYYVVARGTFTLPDGTVLNFQRRSNTACVEQLAQIFAPNAFAPRGENQEFRPVLLFGEDARYLLQVFDRYGQLLFESRDPMDGWDGRKDGADVPQGGYVYRIRLEQQDGRVVEKSGMVVLLR